MNPTPRGAGGSGGSPERSGQGGIGVFGGTFDPPHVAHLAAAVWARAALGLERVLLVVAGDPWQKSAVGRVTPAADRLAMARAACEGIEGIEVCDWEVRRAGPSYTVDTLSELGRSGDRLVMVLGGDAVASLPTWHRFTELPGLAELAVVDRGGHPYIDLSAGGFDPVAAGFTVHHVALPRLDISSTGLRARLLAGAPVDGLVPPAVVAYVRAGDLYRGSL